MPELILEPGRTEKHYYADLWRYRELFLILAWRDIAVRYKQTIIGVSWSLIGFRGRWARTASPGAYARPSASDRSGVMPTPAPNIATLRRVRGRSLRRP